MPFNHRMEAKNEVLKIISPFVQDFIVRKLLLGYFQHIYAKFISEMAGPSSLTPLHFYKVLAQYFKPSN